jgi:hypothetical protein
VGTVNIIVIEHPMLAAQADTSKQKRKGHSVKSALIQPQMSAMMLSMFKGSCPQFQELCSTRRDHDWSHQV